MEETKTATPPADATKSAEKKTAPKTATPKTPPAEKTAETPEAKVKKVRVICEGTLGTALLVKGKVTDSEEYVALLETERGRTLVEEVK